MTELHTNGGVSVFKIEQGVPIPGRKNVKAGVPRVPRYPFLSMVSGDSLYLEGLTNDQTQSALAHTRRKLEGSKWVTRSDEGGTRVWRVI